MKMISKQWIFPILLVLYEFAVNLSNDMYLPGLPELATDLKVSHQLAELTVSAWLSGAAFAQLFLGPLSDFRGRRFVLLGGGFIFLLATLGCSLSHGIGWILLLRFFQGTAVCSLMVAGYASIHESFNDKDAIRVLSWMGSAAVIAPLVGPLLGVWVLSWGHWRIVFALLFGLGLPPLLGLWFLMPETNLSPNRSALKPALLIGTYLRIFKNRTFMLSALSSGFIYAGVMIWLTASPFLMIDTLGMSRNIFGVAQIPIFGSYLVGSWLMRRHLDRLGAEKLIHIGLLISTFSSLCLLLGGYWFSLSLAGLVLPMAGFSLGFGLAMAPLNRITLSSTSEGKGSACALFYMCMEATGAVGSFLVSWIGSGTAVLVAVLMLAVALLAMGLNDFRRFARSALRAN